MTQTITRRSLVAATAGLLATPAIVRAADSFKLRCSLDTAPSHMRGQSMEAYLKALEAGSGGRIKTEIFHAGALFKDANVTKAVVQGQVEMAAPGTWVLTGFIADCDFVNLPALFGQPLPMVRRAIDGKSGQHINDQLRAKLKLRVLGPWLELGMQHWYSSTKALHSYADLKGMKVRNAGGAAMAWRTRFFDAIPNTTAWPDVPLALSQGTFDGVISTNESCASAQLWEAGLKYALLDHQNVNCYVPLISEAFYAGLPADLQKLVLDTWAAHIADYRMNMAHAQETALNTLKAHNVAVAEVSDADIAAVRAKMMPDQDKLIKDLKLSAELPALLAADLGSAA